MILLLQRMEEHNWILFTQTLSYFEPAYLQYPVYRVK